MTENFNIITEQDKKHASYGLCVLGNMAVGATFGTMAGGQAIAGAAAATVFGLFACPYVAESIKQRLFSQNGRLSESEFLQVLGAAKRQFPLASKAQLLDLIADARREATRFPSKYQC
jgi:hypothetical protein